MFTAATKVCSLPQHLTSTRKATIRLPRAANIKYCSAETQTHISLRNLQSFYKKKKNNRFYVNFISLIQHERPCEGGIIGVSTLHLPAIPHSSSQTSEVENCFIQPNEPHCSKWEQMVALTTILLNTQRRRFKRISGTDIKLFGWLAETMNSG